MRGIDNMKSDFEQLNEMLTAISKNFQNAEESIIALERMKAKVINVDDIIEIKNLSLILIEFVESIVIDLVKSSRIHKQMIEEKIKSGKI